MKKILVLSDSHGNVSNMEKAVRETKPDLILHLGDCYLDAEELSMLFPNIEMEQVIGNCDYVDADMEKIIEVEDFRILMCHGHGYGVKMSLLNIEMSSLEKEVDIALFGHTHQVFYEHNNGLLLFNPGSIGNPPYGIPPSYGVICLDSSEGITKYEINYIE